MLKKKTGRPSKGNDARTEILVVSKNEKAIVEEMLKNLRQNDTQK